MGEENTCKPEIVQYTKKGRGDKIKAFSDK